MADVYLAEDTRLDRTVALKIISEEFGNSERMARFIQEAKAISAIDHPNVAHIYEIGDAGSVRFIAMQYVDGATLNERIHNGPLPTNDILDYTIQIADALAEAHAKGIVHRDIKPSNIMVTTRGQIKVLDFGLAKISPFPASRTSKLETEPGVVLGTVQYMSPEQALGKPVDERTDIFSLGIVLYQMAASRLPFQGDNSLETLTAILNSQPEPPSRFNYSLPAELERMILKCLEKEPDRRYQSVRELLVDLRNLKRDSDSGVDLLKPLPRKRAGWRRIGAGTALLILIAAMAFVFSLTTKQSLHSLAVLPFINETSDPGTEYLSDGITDSIINRLSQLPELRVLARGTVFTYKGKEVDPRKVGRELDVKAIVTGSIFQRGDELRVQVSLVNTKDGTQMWGEQYNEKLSDIFQVQTEIANEISSRLKVQLTGAQEKRMNRNDTQNLEAYQLYLKGRYYLNKRTESDFKKAADSFQHAINIDPNYAAAYAGLSDCYSLQSNWGFLPANVGYPKARAAAEKAIQLDDRLAEAHTSLASITSMYDWNWPAAEKNFKRAIELNPNYATGHHWYAFYLSQMKRHDEAIREIEKAQQLDPLSLIINANCGFFLYVGRRYDEALRQLERTVDLDPGFALAYQYMGYVYIQKNQKVESINALQKAVQLSPENTPFVADLGWAYALAGRKDEANEILTKLLALSKEQYVPPYHIAAIYLGLQQQDEALRWLEKAYADRSDQLTYIRMEPRWDPLRKDPRFQNLIRRVGLED